MLTYSEAIQLFRYEPETGLLFWQQPGIKRNLSKPAGHTDRHGYCRVMIRGKMYLAHRIIWLLNYGSWPSLHIDHIDQNPRNNRIENLRNVDRSTNGRNAKAKSDNVLGVRGISWTKEGRYQVRLQGKYIGVYDTLAEAQRNMELYNDAHP